MSEDIWKLMQMGMWLIGVQTAVIIAVLSGFFSRTNKKIEDLDQKLSGKIEKLDEKLTDMDRRLCRLEGAFSQKECCMIKDERKLPRVEE